MKKALILTLLLLAAGTSEAGPGTKTPSRRELVQNALTVKHGRFVRSLGIGKFKRTGVQIKEAFDYRSELLMLARAIYSETNDRLEQEIVGWIIRNRVENGYRGELSYRAVTLDPIQFSAFNSRKLRQRFLGLGFESKVPGWQAALNVARNIIRSDYSASPLPRNVMHFFSPRSMTDGKTAPDWALPHRRVHLQKIDPSRLQIYAGIN